VKREASLVKREAETTIYEIRRMPDASLYTKKIKESLPMKNNNNMETAKLKPLRVLIVEDNEDDALLVIRELGKNDYKPDYERVETAAEMKTALNEKTWDIILCDYKLPKFSAPKAIELLKETRIDIPLIVISGTIGEETAIECMKAGARDFFMKGKLSRLAAAIEREIKEAEMRRRQREAEEALLASEEKYRLVVENAQEAIIVTQDLKVVFSNRAAIGQSGYPEEIFLSQPFTNFIHPDDRNMVADNHFRRLKGEEIPEVQNFRIIREDGDIRWVNLSSAIISWKGKPAVLNFLNDITEQKKAEEILRQSEEKYRMIAEIMTDVITVMDMNLSFTFVSPSITRLRGFTVEESMEQTLEDVMTPESLKLISQIYTEEIEREAAGDADPNRTRFMELNEYRKDGSTMWAEVGISFLRDSDGRPVGILSTTRDCNTRKKTEDALRQSEEKYRLLFEYSPMGLLYFDKNGVIMACNDNFVKIIGSSLEALIGLNMLNLPDKGIVSAVRQALNGSTGLYEGIYHSVTAPKITPVKALFTPMNAEGGVVQGGMGIIEDVTEQIEIENERKQNLEKASKALHATVRAMASIVETRDPYTAGHQHRVADLARAIAAEMNLAGEQIEGIHMAGTIHDIGKISVPAEILTKPGKLTEIEYGLVKTHPLAGHDILKDIDFPWPVADAVLQHHERIDGSGYPEGLKGEAILPEARILAVADVVEAIASHRPYRPSLGIEAAIEEIYKNRLILYDSNVVDACIKLFREKGYKLI
jgi:PAS domain S-box-containing protein